MTHKHAKVSAWLKRHPRVKMHFTPTSSSWMNLVERFFADLDADVIRTGSFASVGQLVRDIEAISTTATPIRKIDAVSRTSSYDEAAPSRAPGE